jgi:hypothetical protein
MAKLVIYPGTPQAREFELKPGTNFVGRGFANDFTIEDDSVSTSHAQIVVDGGSATVKDLGSTNGTYLNHEPVKEAVLQPGQTLRMGGVEMLFENPVQTTAPGMTDLVPPALSAPLPPIGSDSIGVSGKPSPLPPMPPVGAVPPAAARVRVNAATPGGTAVLRPEAVPLPIELPPPPSAAPAPVVPGMMELPEGKSACKFHQKNPAQWFCQKCHTAFCSLCVTSRQTGGSTGYFCRTCGVQCVPVKVKYVAGKEKKPVIYSDVMVLVRSIGFGFGAAVLAGILWAVLSKIMGPVFLMMPPLLCWGTGGLCGYGVKVACQDRPGIVFSLIACGFCVLGVIFGEVGVVLAGVRSFFGVYTLFGLLCGLFTAWKIGGGDF